jgi:hypothetical protein
MVEPVQRPPRGKRRQVVVLVVFLILAAGCFAGAWFFTRSSPTNANVGDCVKQTGTDSLSIVKCDDPDAAYKVVGRVDGKTQVEATLDACEPYVSQGAQQVYWQGKQGETGLVLCLAKNAK